MKAKEARLKMFCRTERHKRKGIGEKGHIPYHLLFGMSLAVVLMFAGIGIVSATADYYVATWGCDNNTGTSVGDPWQHPSYATQQAKAGDTIYLVNGTWIQDFPRFANSGNATHPIVLTAYNGTPTFYASSDAYICFKITDKSYININGIKISNYKRGIQIRDVHNMNLTNIEFDPAGDYAVYVNGNCSYIVIDSCEMYNCTWSTIQLDGQVGECNHIKIINNVMAHNPVHGFIDLAAGHGLNYIDIINNNLSDGATDAIFGRVQEWPAYPNISKYWNISNNVITDITYRAFAGIMVDSCIINNSFSNIGSYCLYITSASNLTINDNYFSSTMSISGRGAGHTINFSNNDVSSYYANQADILIEDPLQSTFDEKIRYDTTSINTRFTDGKVFKVEFRTGSGGYSVAQIEHTNTSSNVDIKGLDNGDVTLNVTTYNMTAKSVAANAFVTVNKFDTSLSQGEFLVDFTADTTGGNEVIFTVWDLKPSYFYLIKRDGTDFATVQANSSGRIQFSNSQWSVHRFTIEQSSTPPDTGTISGIVTNTTGATIQETTITVEGTGKSGATDANGVYTITDVPINTYTVICTAQDYQDVCQYNIGVSEGVTTTVNFALISSTITPIGDLVAEWRFEEGTGEIAADTSVNTNNGTLVNMDVTAWVPGTNGTALQFDGGDDYVDCGHDASLDITDAITIETWLNPNVAGEGVSNAGPVCKAEAEVDWSWQLRYNDAPGGYMGFQFNGDPDGSTWVSVNQNLTPGEWYHIAGTFDGTTIRCYLNGVEADTNILSAIKSGNATLFIGQDGWGNIFNGIVDELKIYNRALTTEEIQADYEAGLLELNTLSGTVTSPCGTIIPNATVTLTTRAGAEINTTQTDSIGNYEFANVSPDYYDITATKRSYWSNTNNVTVTAEAPETADIVLCQKGDLNTNSEPADAGDLAMMADATKAGTSDVTYDLDGDGNPADEADLTLLKDVSVGVAELE